MLIFINIHQYTSPIYITGLMLLRSVAPVFFFGAMRLPPGRFLFFCLYIRSIPPFPLPDARFCLLQAKFFCDLLPIRGVFCKNVLDKRPLF